MLQKIQKFGGAMFTPVLLFAFAGIIIGLGTLFTTEVVFGELAAPDSTWFKVWNVILEGGWTVFRQLPLLFVVALPIGMAKKQNARCCMEALVLYLTFNYFISAILAGWGPALGIDFEGEVGGATGLTMIANIKTLDMGMIGALAISGLVIFLHNRYFDTELPEWLGTFSGSTFVFMVGFFVMIPVAILAVLVWPKVQMGMQIFQGFVLNTGSIGVWVFVFLERLLIPFGLHHLMYSPFYYDNIVVAGGIYSAWAQQLPELAASTASLKSLAPYASYTATGWSKIFGCPGIALAFYSTARPEKKKTLLALLIPITLTAILCGVTEPIEFTFLFIAPALFAVHAFLSATLAMIMNLLGIVGVYSGGAIEMASLNWIPLASSHWQQFLIMLGVGLVFTGIWFVVFRFLILKFDFKTPGREDEEEEVKFYSKDEYRESKGGAVAADGSPVTSHGNKDMDFAQAILDALGGPENINDVTNCMTRLRVNVNDPSLVQEDKYFKKIGTHGAGINGKSVQVIVGMSVPKVRDNFEKLL